MEGGFQVGMDFTIIDSNNQNDNANSYSADPAEPAPGLGISGVVSSGKATLAILLDAVLEEAFELRRVAKFEDPFPPLVNPYPFRTVIHEQHYQGLLLDIDQDDNVPSTLGPVTAKRIVEDTLSTTIVSLKHPECYDTESFVRGLIRTEDLPSEDDRISSDPLRIFYETEKTQTRQSGTVYDHRIKNPSTRPCSRLRESLARP
ncbi:hypothetical protein F5Y11DRAFT_351283 [Daldinia sp. FL1419]|nr:hypothetical protein F5Y11DRAFT_351283 [Daldinia sp. FL1419]